MLRQELKAQRGLSPEEVSEVSRAAFAFYRWHGWLERSRAIAAQISQAIELARRFVENPVSFSDKDMAARAVPRWLGQEMETPVAWLRALQAEPRLWLRARPGQGRGLAATLGDCVPSDYKAIPEALEYRGRHDLFRTPEFHKGEFELQDISSQAVSVICAPKAGETWWDACAGEGGKMLHFSDLMQNQGLIWASDRAEWRLQRLKRRAARARVFNYRSALWDGGSGLPTKTKFNGVLVDAPCSGVGTWHRNPHARWTTTTQDVAELSEVQSQLLKHASANVKPGGKLIYAVCTLTRAETVEVASRFRKTSPEFESLPIGNPLETGAPPGESLLLWPQTCGGNGMFVAAWRRRS